VSDEVKKRIEALAAANAQAAAAEKAEEPKSETRDFAAEIKSVVESQTSELKEKEPESIKEKPAAEEKIPETAPSSVEKSKEAEPPPLFAEEMKPVEPVAAPAEQTGTPFDRLDVPMGKLLSLKTVTAAFISSRDGLLIKNYAEKREDIEEISALIAAIYNEAFESFKYLDEGTVEKIIIEKNRETICVITAGESLLCVITKPEAKPGLIFVYARKIIDEIREVLG
jgi:predicted regulator of Ras-like GTPase activity (Roadblock/LC7/MglB family)